MVLYNTPFSAWSKQHRKSSPLSCIKIYCTIIRFKGVCLSSADSVETHPLLATVRFTTPITSSRWPSVLKPWLIRPDVLIHRLVWIVPLQPRFLSGRLPRHSASSKQSDLCILWIELTWKHVYSQSPFSRLIELHTRRLRLLIPWRWCRQIRKDMFGAETTTKFQFIQARPWHDIYRD